MNKPQQLRYTDEELSLLNGAFGGKTDLFLLLRKFFLQGELTPREEGGIRGFSPAIIAILKKTFLPEIDFETPVGQVIDIWMTVPTKDISLADVNIVMKARKIVVDYIKGRLTSLEYKIARDEKEIDFSSLEYNDKKTPEQALIDLSARNSLINHIEGNVSQLWVLAGQTKETPEQIKRRLFKDSAK
jgi:hypothetical protein